MNQDTNESRSAPLLSAFDSLLAATSAFKNLRAIALLALSLLAAALVSGAAAFVAIKLGWSIIAFAGGVLAFLIVFYGANAVGILLLKDAQGEPSYGIGEAVERSLATSHRLLGVAILQFLIVLALVLAVALVLFVCRIPFLGPVMFAFALPVSAVLLGMLVFSLFYIMLPLAGPAVWSGGTTFQVIARLNSIARSKLIAVIMQQFILLVILLFASGIIFSILMIGLSIASSLSAAILGVGGAMHPGELMLGGGFFGERAGHMIAGGIGGGLLFAVAAVIPGLIAIKGNCIIYLNIMRGIDASQAERDLEGGVAAMKRKAEEARERARQMAEQQTARQAPAAEPVPPPRQPDAPPPPHPEAPAPRPSMPGALPTPPAASLCPGCGEPHGAEDAFCGNCGRKLK
jgi:hypothetical protein